MKIKNNLIKGTFILTFSGLFSRFLGFFYRIFLSRAIGAEGVGLYQLVFPVYMLACSITVSGIQSAISRTVAARSAGSGNRSAASTLFAGTLLSALLCVPVSAILFLCHQPLSVLLLKNVQTAPLLKLTSFAILFGSFHACVDGYYFGIQNTAIPAVRQMLEQMFRFLLLLLFCHCTFSFSYKVSPSTAVLILVLEEIFSALFSFAALFFHFARSHMKMPFHVAVSRSFLHLLSELHTLIVTALPLSGNRILVCVLQSVEASLLPYCLQLSGYDSGESLRIYGILSGMALPMILFPTAVTYSLSTLVMPSVSAARAAHSSRHMQNLIRKSCLSCLGIGIFCSLFFLFLGRPITGFLFQNQLAGYYVQGFAFVCPMLYLNPVLFSILNGLGKSSFVFLYNFSSLLLRLAFVLLVVPKFGISGYVAGIFLSHLLCNLLCIRCIRNFVYPAATA